MGLTFSMLYNIFMSKKNYRILMLGLDAAGKTTILYKLKLGEVVTTIPTIGFNVESVEYRNIKMTVWDVGGQTAIRPLWNYYFQGSQALIYVVDSNDPERFALAREELESCLKNDCLRDVKVLILNNKQDLPKAQPNSAVAEALGLTEQRHHEWVIQSCCATNGDGLFEGIDSLYKLLSK